MERETRLRVDAAGCTDMGLVRSDNQDHFVIASLRKLMEIEATNLPRGEQDRIAGSIMARLYLVADGVGGGTGGAEASRLALRAISTYVATTMRCFYRMDRMLEADLLRALERSVEESHATVQEAAGGVGHMATTLTMAHVLWPRAYLIHVGDSRCYRLRGEELRRITKDQTLAQGLVDAGAMEAESVDASPLSHVLTSAVGSTISPATYSVGLTFGDALILCTDGLTKHVSDDRLQETVCQAADARDACDTLIRTALDAGGSDNVTVIVARFQAESEAG